MGQRRVRLRLWLWWLSSSSLSMSSSLTVFSTLTLMIDADGVFGALAVGSCLRFSRLIDFFFDFCPVLALLLLREDDADREPPAPRFGA